MRVWETWWSDLNKFWASQWSASVLQDVAVMHITCYENYVVSLSSFHYWKQSFFIFPSEWLKTCKSTIRQKLDASPNHSQKNLILPRQCIFKPLPLVLSKTLSTQTVILIAIVQQDHVHSQAAFCHIVVLKDRRVILETSLTPKRLIEEVEE